ncbi:hypothetical protein EB796_011973 [Bugula neritina]|uniref:Uncharacterized protein n=1 Tax=Bugula neritina TaxID=10212 RepID=A0A7J7JRX3_BUGNE|nr:hypothetical protein EB796_013516 [Bugula neritina]KAF6029715.1 hypothetical protein EB796_011973 [Bugula neritina]
MEFFQEEHDTTPLLPKENVVESKEDKSKRANSEDPYITILFRNLSEIIETSEQLLARFRQIKEGIDFEHQLIGE